MIQYFNILFKERLKMHSIFKKLLLLWSIFFTSFLFADGTDIGIHISDASVNEGSGQMTFTVTIDELPLSLLSSVRVSYKTLNSEGTAVAGVDYVETSSTLLSDIYFTPYSDSLSKTITIDIMDNNIYEGDKYFYVQFSTESTGYLIDGDGKAKGTIIEDEAAPLELTLHNRAVSETDSDYTIQFTARLNQPAPAGGVTLTYETKDNTALAGSDYTATSGTLTIPAGSTDGYIPVDILADLLPESTENFYVKILSMSVGTLADDTGLGTLYDNDQIKVDIEGSNVVEGVTGDSKQMQFRIFLAKPYPLVTPLTINYETQGGSAPSATAGIDYVVNSGSVTFNQNETEKIVNVSIIGDEDLEPDEFVKMVISGSSYIDNSQAQALILNDDGSFPTIDFSTTEVSIIEGNTSTQDLNFTLTLDKAMSLDATFKYDTWSATAKPSDNDYVYTTGTYTIPAGETTATITVPINGDTQIEDDEYFYFVIQNLVNLTAGSTDKVKGIIKNDDGSYPELSVDKSDYTIIEGNSSSQTINVTFTLDKPALASSTFTYMTQDMTAQFSDNDYKAIPSITYTINEGDTNITIPVTIYGDTNPESDESFKLSITNPQNFKISGGSIDSTINIINDDIDEHRFNCSIDAYIFGSDTFDTQTDAYGFDLTDGSEMFKTLNIHLSNINASGYNVTDNYIWGYDRANYKVVRLNNQFEVTSYDIAGLPTFAPANDITPTYHAGDVSLEGILHLSTISDPNTIYRVDINPSSINYLKMLPSITLSSPLEVSDFAFSPTDKMLYAVDMDEHLIRIDPSDGTVTPLGALTIPSTGNVVSVFFDVEGNMYVHHTSSIPSPDAGKVYKIIPPKKAEALITAAYFSKINLNKHGDGARCPYATVGAGDEEPFVCDNGMYISSSVNRVNPDSKGKMWLHRIDTTQNPFDFLVLDDEGSDQLYNALAFSDVDNYIYGLYKKELLKLSKTGKVINLGKVDDLPDILTDKQLFAGAIYGDDYYVSGPGQDYDKIFKIKLNDKSVTEISLDRAISLLDFSFTPDGQYLHGIIDGGTLVKIDITSGHVESIGTPHTGYQFDSTFSDNNGRFFANDSLGHGFFEFDLSTGEKRFLSDSQEAEFNDGANCLKGTLLFTDYGDAPSSYGMPQHNIANGIFMGAEVDHDISPYSNADATGDDLNGIDDEDGVTLTDGGEINGTYFAVDSLQELNITVSKAGYLNAWIDYDINGVFDTSDKIIDAQALTAGTHTISFNVPNSVTTNTVTYIRFRYASTPTLSATENANDGEVEDYAVKFGSAFRPLKGAFNIERTDSGGYPIGSTQRNAWYTQIVGRDFDYSILFYDENLSTLQEMDNITVKIELVDTLSDAVLYERYAHIKNTPAVNRIDIVSGVNASVDDLATLPASKDVHFRVSYGVDDAGAIIQADCVGDPKTCFESFAKTRTDKAQDNFAIRPEKFTVNIADGSTVLNTMVSTLRLAAGYEYNLSVIAAQYHNNNIASPDYNESISRQLTFIGHASCANKENNITTETLKDGKNVTDTSSSLYNPFKLNNVGLYQLHLEDKDWTTVDWNKATPDCIVESNFTSTNGNLLSGCNITMGEDINISYYPHHFDVNFTINNLPNSGHDNFIYMSKLDASYNEVAIQFKGEITAKSEENITTTNFIDGCMAEDIVVVPDALVKSEDGINQLLKTSCQVHLIPKRVTLNISRMIRFNNDENDTYYDSVNYITSALTIPKSKFLVGDNNGSMSLDLRYNINKHYSRTINPIQVAFKSLTFNSIDAQSSANGIVDHYTPAGGQLFSNGVRNFYFTQVAPDSRVYSKVNIDISPTIRTPLNVDIFCDKNNSYCDETNVTTFANINSSPRQDTGWYLSIAHDENSDGMIIELNDSPDIATIVPDENITLPQGRNGLIVTTISSCEPPYQQTVVTITPTPVLRYDPDPLHNGLPQYEVPCTKNPSAWTGIGETGNIIESNTTTIEASKLDW